MNDRLDALVRRLAALPADRSLDTLEAEVEHGIYVKQHQQIASAALATLRVAAIGVALAMGVTAGGATAARAIFYAHPSATFSGSAHLAPSNLLEGTE
jgi:hypothetical protein